VKIGARRSTSFPRRTGTASRKKLLKKTGKFTEIMISVTGGILHNIGQIGMACLILETAALRYYLPFLLISGIIAGIVVGILSAVLVQRIKLP
jgi:heptaprenyl diphosphate synthase